MSLLHSALSWLVIDSIISPNSDLYSICYRKSGVYDLTCSPRDGTESLAMRKEQLLREKKQLEIRKKALLDTYRQNSISNGSGG